ncbi:MAG TPA: nucleotidyltransferase family protein [Mucilaginibacter sp.]|jgi:molybdenum cofactor cytidylyltransferase
MTGLIILAAGSSSRLGTPKQNLIYRGQTLLQKAIETAISSVCKPVIVVLGANESTIKPTITDMPVNIIYNPDWQEGMASSVRLGIKEMQKTKPVADSVILMLCDQPFVDANILNTLVEAKTNNKAGIFGCAYNNTIGAPVLFDDVYFDDLLSLRGREGAKKLLTKYKDKVISVPFPLGSFDIDTVEDYERIKNNHQL